MKQIAWILLFFALFAQACAYTIKIKDGKTAFDQKQYATAIPFLKKEFKKAKSPAKQGKIAYMLGESYRLIGDGAEAVDWFAKAYAKSYGPDALKAQALALKQKGDYEMAMMAFQELGREIGSPYEYRREVNACQDAIDWKKTEKRRGITIERPDFNTSDNDYSPAIYKDGQLVFVSDRQTNTEDKKKYAWTNRRFADLVVLKDKQITPFDASLNTPANEGPLCFSQDFSELIFTRCDEEGEDAVHCRLFSCKWDGNKWSAPLPLPFQLEGTNYIHPALSKDENTLFFASDHKDGWGGYDLYFSERTNTGWSTPQLLSRIINSIGDDVFPTLDGDTLYFSSNYHGGMGGLDIFRSTRTGTNQWTPPKNLKSPLNSSGDDFGLIVTQTGNGKDFLKEGYLSSNRNGQDDILFFRKKAVIKPPVAKPKEIVYKNFLKVISLEKIYADPENPSSKVLGRKPLAEVQLNITPSTLEPIKTNEYGEYEFELDKDTDYTFSGSKEGYLTTSVTYSSKGFGQDPDNPVQHYELEMVLDKIFKNKEIRLENIYYDFNKSDIREDAKPSLDKLAAMLIKNPDIKIELASHTDCRGGEKYNRELSQKRAESAVAYLISKGIDATRLMAHGYGKSQPAVNCACSKCTEEEHQYNRRTTFKIL